MPNTTFCFFEITIYPVPWSQNNALSDESLAGIWNPSIRRNSAETKYSLPLCHLFSLLMSLNNLIQHHFSLALPSLVQ